MSPFVRPPGQQEASFGDDKGIDRVYAAKQHVFAQAKSGDFFFWGQSRSGLALEASNRVVEQPLALPGLSRYCMSALACSHDHVLALSYTIVLQFLMPTLPEAQSRCEMHAIHVHDGGIGNTEQLLEMIDNHKKSEDVFFLNDFDLPYINIRARFPKLRRLKARKQ